MESKQTVLREAHGVRLEAVLLIAENGASSTGYVLWRPDREAGEHFDSFAVADAAWLAAVVDIEP